MRHALLPLLLLLSACGAREPHSMEQPDIMERMNVYSTDSVAPAPAMESADMQTDYPPLSGPGDTPAPATASYLAYRHSLGLVLPTAAVEPTMAAHMR